MTSRLTTPLSLSYFTLFFILNLSIIFQGHAEVIYEEGYTVKTVFDGNKLKLNPHSVSPLPTGSHNLLLLDSSNSVFYTLSLPLSQESVIKRFAGKAAAGFSDGDASLAMFNKPRSFAMDMRGNVYVADRSNYAIRKISASGVTTIAGGFTKTAGRADGPGQNATFSADYELTLVPDLCTLLVLDHGSKLIRQIDLKQEDCRHSQSGVGASAVWTTALVVSCLVGLLIGFVIRPYVIPHGELKLLKICKSWTHYLMNLGRRAQMPYFASRNGIASHILQFLRQLTSLILSHLSLLLSFRFNKVNRSSIRVHKKEYVSLLDSDNIGSLECASSQKYTDQLRDLICFNGDLALSNNCDEVSKQEPLSERDETSSRQISELMQANIVNFAENAQKATTPDGSFLGVSTLVKRR